jgi:hypothetical protein
MPPDPTSAINKNIRAQRSIFSPPRSSFESGNHCARLLIFKAGADDAMRRYDETFASSRCASAIQIVSLGVFRVRRHLRRQIFFNLVDQLENIDRLRQNWMPLKAHASLCLTFRG